MHEDPVCMPAIYAQEWHLYILNNMQVFHFNYMQRMQRVLNCYLSFHLKYHLWLIYCHYVFGNFYYLIIKYIDKHTYTHCEVSSVRREGARAAANASSLFPYVSFRLQSFISLEICTAIFSDICVIFPLWKPDCYYYITLQQFSQEAKRCREWSLFIVSSGQLMLAPGKGKYTK